MKKLARSEEDEAIDYQALYDDIDNDRTRFYQAARKDLGIQSGDIPSGSRWDLDLSRDAIKRQPRTNENAGVDGDAPTTVGESPDRPAEDR